MYIVSLFIACYIIVSVYKKKGIYMKHRGSI